MFILINIRERKKGRKSLQISERKISYDPPGNFRLDRLEVSYFILFYFILLASPYK